MSNVILGLTLPIPIACAISIIILCCKAYWHTKKEEIKASESENPTAQVAHTPVQKDDECTDPV